MITDFKDLKELVKNNLNITNVLNMYGVYLDNNNKSNCILHNSEGRTCFHVKNNRFVCYSCNARGDAIDFIKEMEGIDYVEAIYKMAYELGYISIEERDKKRLNANTKSFKPKNIPKASNNHVSADNVIRKQKELTERDKFIVSTVYNALAYVCGLDDSDKNTLLSIRKLQESNLLNYFTIKPCTIDIINKIISLCFKYYGITEEEIEKVPGFYKNDKGFLEYNNKSNTLAMKIRDSEGYTLAIQIRNKFAVNKKDVKYYYLSSNKQNGNTSYLTIDVLYSDINSELKKINIEKAIRDKKYMFITEGKFKGEIITQNYNSIVMAIPGIQTYHNKLSSEINKILNNNSDVRYLFIALDSDMNDNIYVGKAIIDIVEKELKNITINKSDIYVLLWNSFHGKGIDDIILNNHKDSIKKINIEAFISLYKKFMKEIEPLDRKNPGDRIQMSEIFNKIFNL